MMFPLLLWPLAESHPRQAEYAGLVADLLLTWELKTYRTRLSAVFGATTARELYGYVEPIIGAPEAKRVRRALAYALRNRCDFRIASVMYSVPMSVMDEIVRLASPDAMTAIQDLAHSRSDLSMLTAAEEKEFTATLAKFARKTANMKLKFLACYDTYDIEDYVQTLMIRSMTTVWRYAHFVKDDGVRDTLKITNYAKAAIHNTAMSIIRSSTLESRSRIRNQMDTCGDCPACKRGETVHCYYAAPNYEATTVSVDAPSSRVHKDLSVSEASQIEARLVLGKIIARSPDVAKVLQSVFGSTDIGIITTRLDDVTQRQFMAALATQNVDMGALQEMMA